MELVWGCAFTVFICTWTALHANLPPYRSSSGWRIWYKIRLMLVAILAPEYVAATALMELSTALSFRNAMRLRGLDRWTLKQSFYVQMGGYMVVCGDDSSAKPITIDAFMRNLLLGHIKLSQPLAEAKDRHASTSSEDEMNPSIRAVNGKSTVVVESGTAHEFEATVTSTDAIVLPWVSNEDIDDRSKGSYLLKAISCMQLVWLIVQSIARQVQSLALCPLEATTIAYVACALFTYTAWWQKPYDLESPSIIRIQAGNPMVQYLTATAQTRIHFGKDSAMKLEKRIYWLHCAACLAMLQVYSGLHFLAWSMAFASVLEQQLWRWLSVTLSCLHWLFIIIVVTTRAEITANLAKDTCISCWLYCLDRIVQPIAPEKLKQALRTVHLLDNGFNENLVPRWYVMVPLLCLTTVYVVARAYLLVEAFVGLRHVPISLYSTVDWVKFLPNLS